MDGREYPKGRTLSRRDFLKASGALAGAYALGLTGCGGEQGSSGKTTLTFLTYELPDNAVFEELFRRYEKKNPNVTIQLQKGGTNYWEQLDTRLAAGEGPDLVRIQYQRMGGYASAGALVDISDTLDQSFGEGFVPKFWQATQFEGACYGLPHHTDTFATFYNKKFFDELGVEAPKSIDESWSWDEFINIARRIKEEGLAEYGFAMNWGGGSPYRWLPFLYQNGGTLLGDDLKTPKINSPAGIEALAWTQQWFTEELVPPSTTSKSDEEVEPLFANGTIGMMLNGDWVLPAVGDLFGNDDAWGVTYMPRRVEMASDLGGNGLCVTSDSQYPEEAADVLKFLGEEANMEYFLTEANFLPTRTSLTERTLKYKAYSDEMNLFTEQSDTIPDDMAKAETIPTFIEINEKMADELDLMLTSGQSPEETAQNLSAIIENSTADQ